MWKYVSPTATSKATFREIPTTVQADQYRFGGIQCKMVKAGGATSDVTPNLNPSTSPFGLVFSGTGASADRAATCVFLNIRKPKIETLCDGGSFSDSNNSDPYVEGKLTNTDVLAQANGWQMKISLPDTVTFAFEENPVGTPRFDSLVNGVPAAATCQFVNGTNKQSIQCSLTSGVLGPTQVWSVRAYVNQLVFGNFSLNTTVDAVNTLSEPVQSGWGLRTFVLRQRL